jgi:hypothetical protein
MQANDTHHSSNSLLTCCRHAAREAEPKDYDVTDSNEKRDLLKATYCRIGSCDEGFPETTTVEAMSEAHRLKKDFQTRPTHRSPVNVDNFTQSMSPRDTGMPREGYGSILPRHTSEHGKRQLKTTYHTDYQYQGEWSSPGDRDGEPPPSQTLSYHHTLSEFTDTADHRRHGINTWQDAPGSSQPYHQ